MKSKLINQQDYNKLIKNARQSNELPEDYPKDQLGYFVKTSVSAQYTVYIDEEFTEPRYYRGVASLLQDANEGDTIVFMVNSPGGRVSGLTTLLEGLRMTDAQTMAVLVGECHSAASMFSLHCDMVYVTDSAEMLCHNISYGAGGKSNDIKSQVDHTSKVTEKFLRETYEHFLTEKEIEDVIAGRQLYLDANDIRTKLERKLQILQKQAKKQLQDEKQATKPARKSKKIATKPKEDQEVNQLE